MVGFDQGIILSSGDTNTLNGPNVGDATSTDNMAPGDVDLESLLPGYTTYDAVILEFDFTCNSAQNVVFQYVFGSEEYNEYVDTPYNDVFGFFLNGVNIAVAPTGCSLAGSPVSINNVNCGNPYVGVGPNCDCFRNNDLDDGGGLIDTELDGLTQTFYATGTIQRGSNHIKIALADAGDPVLDSDVMIRCQSFTCGAAPTTGACCLTSGQCVTLTSADCDANGGSYHGDLVPCTPDLCGTGFGACGYGDDLCVITDPFSCVGQYMGDGTTCEPALCSNLTGACCADAAVCEIQTLADCGDTFMGVGATCDPNPCEAIAGACCHDNGFCEITLVADCGDYYQGNRTVCDPNPCVTSEVESTLHGSGKLVLGVPVPTPTTGEVEIDWSLTRAGVASLTLWDASGRQLATLFRSEVNAGEGRRSFALADGAGRALPAGVYWMKLESGGDHAVRKVVIAN